VRVGLGTAQFGLDYGITNRHGQVPVAEMNRILDLALRRGVTILDTAGAYGTAEERLGDAIGHSDDFDVVTKIPPLPPHLDGAARTERFVEEAASISLAHLRMKGVRGLLMHAAGDLTGKHGAYAWRALERLRDGGAAEMIGASVYAGEELDALLQRYPLQIVQIPLSVFDQRLARSGHLARLKSLGVEIHARSVFLQGVLLMTPEELPRHLAPLEDVLRQFRAASAAAGRTPIQAAMAYVLGYPEVDVAVVGATTAEEFAAVLSASSATLPGEWFAPFAVSDPNMVDPSRWTR